MNWRAWLMPSSQVTKSSQGGNTINLATATDTDAGESTSTAELSVIVTTNVRHDSDDLSAALACRSCGRGVDGPHDPAEVERVTLTGKEETTRTLSRVVDIDPILTAVARCAVCREIRNRTAALLKAHPRVGAGIGSASIGLSRIELSLAALDVVGMPSLVRIRTDNELVQLINELSQVGRRVEFARRASGVLYPGVKPGAEFVALPWSHLSAEERSAVRAAVARLLRTRIERPRPHTPPADGLPGCLHCRGRHGAGETLTGR